MHLQVNYNEGWNVYNAVRVSQGLPLYPERFGWTSVNYPMLSFAVMAGLHRFTHDFLFTARVVSILSLLAGAVLVAALLRSVGVRNRPALLAGLFCWSVFCAEADRYVGMDDPQLLAQAVFLLTLLLYVRHRRRPLFLVAAALLFVVALCLKHNLIDIPFAVFLDLLFVSAELAGWFLTWLLVFLSVAVWFNVHFGGHFFLPQMLTPRRYFLSKVPGQLRDVLGPILVPVLLAAAAAWKQRFDPRRRLILLMLGTALVLGSYFSGGSGVATNALFTCLVAVSLSIGLFLDDPTLAGTLQPNLTFQNLAPAFCFVWLLLPLAFSGNWNIPTRWKELQVQQAGFKQDVSFLRDHPGPALCESLLECYEAGKPYLYDPFNATRLVWFGKLNSQVLIEQLRRGRFSVVQADAPLDEQDTVQKERFAPEIRKAILGAYVRVPANNAGRTDTDDTGKKTAMYIPRRNSTGQAMSVPLASENNP